MSNHTPTPYRASKLNWKNESSEYDVYITGAEYENEDGQKVATAVCIVKGNETSGTIAEDTAAFIVRACNAHDELVAMLEKLVVVSTYGTPSVLIKNVEFLAEKATRLIAKIKGTP